MNKNIKSSITYCEAILEGFNYLLSKYPEVFVIGQGLWSPWYVGNSMKGLDTKYGLERIIDTPVSEAAVTGAGVGASILKMKPIVVHPRIDFMLYALDPIVNQAAKWSYMFSGQSNAGVTIRAIINRGGEQGAQHSQALHSWFSHIPGLRVVMPSTVSDARDLLIAATLSSDPVIYIDDRWLYECTETIKPIKELNLKDEGPRLIKTGKNLTVVGVGYTTYLASKAIREFEKNNPKISVELIDLRILNPIKTELIIRSVEKTERLLVVDGGWKNCGIASEIIASVMEKIDPGKLKKSPFRLCLEDCPAPTASIHENLYYPNKIKVLKSIEELLK